VSRTIPNPPLADPSAGPVATYFHELAAVTVAGWNRFWFTPSDPATLGLIRILAGAMLFYTHLVWTRGLVELLGPNARLAPGVLTHFYEQNAAGGFDGTFAWSYLNWIGSPTVLWIAHVAALVILAMFTVGLFTRATSILAFLITVSYANRAVGMLFGLDQINGLLALYLMIGPSGAAYSLDNLLRRRRQGERYVPPAASTMANVSIRLIQVHMCVVYFFAGIGKLTGTPMVAAPSWWTGEAMWMSLASYQYQSFPLTAGVLEWISHWPRTLQTITQITLLWELSYAVLVWPRLTRPLVLVMAVLVHLGIAMLMGMWTFGLAMLIGNAAFLSPALVRRAFGRRTTMATAG